MPFFSVVIPLYNKANFIDSTLRSVLAQSVADYEILLIDDCSTDNSLKVASAIASDKIRIISHQKNAGLSASRNTGIKNATGNYIAFLDADDLWKPGFLSEIQSLINHYPEARLFATGYEELYPGKVILAPEFNLKITSVGIINFFRHNLGQPIYCPSSLCVEKSVFEKSGFYNEGITFGEDVDFNIRSNVDFKLAYSPKRLVSYTMFSENQLTNSNLKDKTITDFDFYEALAANNPELKKYLDFHRYVMAKQFKRENDIERFNQMKNGISREAKISGLNLKQRILLEVPLLVLNFVAGIKRILVRNGFKITSYH